MITWTSAAEQDLADIALYLDREAGAEAGSSSYPRQPRCPRFLCSARWPRR